MPSGLQETGHVASTQTHQNDGRMTAGTQTRMTVIDPSGSGMGYWKELFAYRELFVFLTMRDVLVRYKQTWVGVFWAILKPVLAMIVFTVVFGRLAGMSTEGAAPYALLVFAGLLPWQMFAQALQGASDSVVGNRDLVTKVYFPRLVIPASAVLAALADFLVAFAIYLALAAWYDFLPGLRALLVPLFAVQALLLAGGVGLLVSALNVSYRDFRFIVPFAIQFGLFISPVGFSGTVVPDDWKLLYYMNPMAGVIDGFRWCLLGLDTPPYWQGIAMSWVLTCGVAVLGYRTFRARERNFADRI